MVRDGETGKTCEEREHVNWGKQKGKKRNPNTTYRLSQPKAVAWPEEASTREHFGELLPCDDTWKLWR